MTDFSPTKIENSQLLFTREELMREQGCDWWPTVYKNLLPVTDNRKAFIVRKQQIETVMAEDVAAYHAEEQSPWSKAGPAARLVSSEGLSPQESTAEGLKLNRHLGMPHRVKPGNGPDGVPYAQHPEVLEAQANRQRTAEWVAHEEERAAMEKMREASNAFAAAANAEEPDKAEVKRLEKLSDEATAAHAAAMKKAGKLYANPKQGLKIVRD